MELTIKNFTEWCSNVIAMPPSSLEGKKPQTPLFITSVREPVSRFLSWYFYYIEPEQSYNFQVRSEGDRDVKQVSNIVDEGLHTPASVVGDRLHDWLKDHLNDTETEIDNVFNHQSHELLLWTDDHVDEFIAQHSMQSNGVLDFVVIADRFDESLVVMRYLLNWDMKDLAYLKLWNSGSSKENQGDLHEEAFVFEKPLLRWDGLPVKNSLKKKQVMLTPLEYYHT